MQHTLTTQDLDTLTKHGIKKSITDLIGEAEQLAPETNLIELGLDSMHIMRLVNQWRRIGAKITFAELIEHPTLQQWYSLLKIAVETNNKVDSVAQLQASMDSDTHYSEAHFPLTDVQYAYWIGRQDSQTLGGVGCHAYLELNGKDVSAKGWRRRGNSY